MRETRYGITRLGKGCGLLVCISDRMTGENIQLGQSSWIDKQLSWDKDKLPVNPGHPHCDWYSDWDPQEDYIDVLAH